MSAFQEAVRDVLGNEGGYVFDPKDSGGETNWGITARVARAFGYMAPMRQMTREQAAEIYKARYWDTLRLDDVAAVAPRVAFELFDTAVNQGTDAAARYLQRSLNVLNNEGSFYGDTKVDGRVGSMTIAALREFINRRGTEGETVLLKGLNALQGAFYVELAERREKDERFVYGWLKNRL
jgi:lysozyme family protein